MSQSEMLEKAFQQLENQAFASELKAFLQAQNFKAILPVEQVAMWQSKFNLSIAQIGLSLLPVASSYATPKISNFHVGAVVRGTSGSLYFGANHEFQNTYIAQTIHAEQSAISFAWINGEMSLTDIFINYSPCGHCRQFMNELNCNQNLNIHLPNQPVTTLMDYLPNAFGPRDLEIKSLLLDCENHGLSLDNPSNLVQQALIGANFSHAPYSHCYCGVAIELNNGLIVRGSYAENAAFNPSLPALQVALNAVFMHRASIGDIRKVVMVEKTQNLSYQASSEALLKSLNIEFEYFGLNT